MRCSYLVLILVGLLVCPLAAQPAPGVPQNLQKAEWWYSHLIGDLFPFWLHRDAWGDPVGSFPTTRCDDGSDVNWLHACREVSQQPWLMQRERYLVGLSRQTYGYGVMFHMTGDPTFMDLMRAGVDYIRKNNVDRERGGLRIIENPTTRVWGPEAEFRDTQQLAYGLLGLSFYYYLTRDPEVLPDILAIKDYIFTKYYNPQLNAMQWLLANQGTTRWDEKHLVAQLDQMNAYLVLLTPLLPEPQQTQWKKDLVMLSRLMIEQFYSPSENVFFLNANTPQDVDIKFSGTDFGHTIKAMWMIRMAGLIAGEKDLVEFSEKNGPRVLERAYIASNGSWAGGVLPGGTIDTNKTWWVYAELDQFAGTLAMSDPQYAKYLPQTYSYWFNYFVDKQFGEVWNGVDGKTNAPQKDWPKQWPWKNAYHSLEHTLVGMIVTQQLYGEAVPLYFNFRSQPPDERIQPYFFRGTIDSMETSTDWRDGMIWKVQFRNVH